MVAVVVLLCGASTASAASITYTLNCIFPGPPGPATCVPAGPFGMVTLSDNATNPNWVDLTVDLLPESGLPAFLTNLFLNYSGPDPNGSPEYEWLGSNTIDKITFKSNDVGFGHQYLDIEVGPEGELVDPWTGTLKLKKKNTNIFYNLDPSTFNLVTDDPQANPNALVWLAVQREVLTQPSSTWTMIGSIGPQPVSEPGTLLLLGIGLVSLGAWRLRARKP